MQILYGQIQVGNTATAQTATVLINDGTNTIVQFVNPEGASNTQALEVYAFPAFQSATSALTGTNIDFSGTMPFFLVSGTMQLILKVSTAAISITHTYSIACRLKGTLPTATLADSVGTPTLTTNTNRVF